VFKLKLDYCTDSKDCFLFLKTVNSLTTVNEYLFKSFPVIALLIQKKIINNKIFMLTLTCVPIRAIIVLCGLGRM
jgi:hypothetical protein